ncbi:MAG: acyltransferase family protein [Candidatus Bathyarchaeia archaeon]
MASSNVPFLKGRLVALDAFRGIAIVLMILVNNPGGDAYYSFLQHATWNGFTLADLAFPLFVFIVGVSIPFALANKLDQGVGKKALLIRVARRTIILFVLGVFISGFPFGFDPSTFRIMGVLQRLALCYLFASVLFLFLKPKWRILVTLAVPLVYWVLMTAVPVPGYGPGVLTAEGNLSGYVDRLLLDGHVYRWTGTYDPEGLLSTLPALGTALVGVLAGMYLKSDALPKAKTAKLALFGSVSLVIGLLWNLWFPINKNLWTSSYVAFTGGIALLTLAVLFYTTDARGHSSWAKPLTILGLNAILVYVLSEIVNLSLIYLKVPPTESAGIPLKTLIYENLFASWAGSLHGSFLYALAFLAFCWLIAALLYKRRIFIRV